MKRNLIISIQASFESELSDDELDDQIREFIKEGFPQIEDVTPIGAFLISIQPGPKLNFPRSNLDVDEDFSTADAEINRRKAFEKVVKDDLSWEDDDTSEE